MTRRALVLAVPQVALRQFDQWDELQRAWNPFAEKLNNGVLDLKQWQKVVTVVMKIDGRRCKC